MRPTFDVNDPLLRYRLRAVRIGVQVTYLVLGVLGLYPLLDGEVSSPAGYAALVAAAAAGAVLVRLAPWAAMFQRGLGIPALYTWSILDIALISFGVHLTGGATSPTFVLYALTTIFFATAYPRPGQLALLLFTAGCFVGVIAVDHDVVSLGFVFMRLSGLALVAIMASYLAAELLRQMWAEHDTRAESESRANLLARVAAAARGMSTPDPTQVHGAVVDAALDIGFDGSAICLFNEPTRSWHTAQAGGLPATAGPVGRITEDVPGVVRAQGSTVVLADIEGHPAALASIVACPIWSGGELTGALVAGRVCPEAVRPHEVEAVELLAAQAGAALNNARLFDERRAFERRLAHQAFHDALTGLPNRALFLDRLDHALARRTRASAPVAVLFLDLDRFKLVNDSLGHEAGDELLRLAGDRLSGCVRPGDTLARYGGDEFTVLLEQVASSADAVDVAERLLAALSSPFRLRGREVVLGGSIGIAMAGPGSATDPLREADLAMYRAKERGKGRWELFEAALNVRALQRLETETELRRAIERQELFLQYQPMVSVGTGDVVGVEALVRWRHPARGVIAPAGFVPLAEEVGLIIQLGEWVINEACRQTAEWRAQGVRPVPVSVNLAAAQFQSRLFPANLAAAFEFAGVPEDALVLEITESMVMDDVETAVWVMAELRKIGVGLALDDFGQGYSSLGRLKRFPLHSLKIDKVFVDGVVDHAEDRAIIRAVVSLARDLGISVTAEGIETPEQLDQVRRLGCDVGQGFLLSTPVAGDEVPALLERSLTTARALG